MGDGAWLVHNSCPKLPRYNGQKPAYIVNDAHVPGRPGFRRDKTPLPDDAKEVYRRAVTDRAVGARHWYGKDASGRMYRFSNGNDGTVHFSGIEGVGDGIEVPKYARDRLDGK